MENDGLAYLPTLDKKAHHACLGRWPCEGEGNWGRHERNSVSENAGTLLGWQFLGVFDLLNTFRTKSCPTSGCSWRRRLQPKEKNNKDEELTGFEI